MRATSAAMPPKPSRPSVLPVSSHALGADPLAAPHAAVHDRQPARRGPHQGDRVLGHRGVAVALDDVHGDAVLGQFLGVHVAARAGAEEDDVLQAGAAPHHLGRHLAVVVEHEVVAGEQAGQRLAAAPRAARSPSPADRRGAPRGGTRPPDRPPHRETAPSSHPPRFRAASAQADCFGNRRTGAIAVSSALPRHAADPVSTAPMPRAPASPRTAPRRALPRGARRGRRASRAARTRRTPALPPAGLRRHRRGLGRAGARASCCCGSRATCRGPKPRWTRRAGRASRWRTAPATCSPPSATSSAIRCG